MNFVYGNGSNALLCSTNVILLLFYMSHNQDLNLTRNIKQLIA
jgi:hypothetical protein